MVDLPKSGWSLHRYYEAPNGNGECSICGKKHLRWCFVVVHDNYDPIVVGSTCVWNITSSEDEYQKLLSDIKEAKKKLKQRFRFINSHKWIHGRGNLIYRDFPSVRYNNVTYRINIWNNNNGYQLQIKTRNRFKNGCGMVQQCDTNYPQRHRKTFNNLDEIKGIAFDCITEEKIEDYFDKTKQW